MSIEAENGAKLLNQAAEIRLDITECYAQYKEFTKAIKEMTNGGIEHEDLKQAVDAIHYINGGYPSPNSPGRMQAAIDKVVCMYRVLNFIGKGKLVVTYFAQKGISIKMEDQFKIQDRQLAREEITRFNRLCVKFGIGEPMQLETLRDMVRFTVLHCDMLQTEICGQANVVRKEIKPKVIREVGLAAEEFKRGLSAAKLRLNDKKTRIGTERRKNTDSYRKFLAVSKKLEA